MQQKLAAFERVFFHDINNIITGLVGAVELFSRGVKKAEMINVISHSSYRLHKEIDMQFYLMQNQDYEYKVSLELITLDQLFIELRSIVDGHPSSEYVEFIIENGFADVEMNIDISSVLRVLSNMVLNAIEATDKGGTVKLWCSVNTKENVVSFFVYNEKVMPEEVVYRVFQRNYTTKNELGRGLGAYSMKLFGEQVLGGKVDFTSKPGHGTTFRFVLPLSENQRL